MALLGIPQDAFVWGQGGRRLTADDIAQQRLVADQQRMAGADFSPAGSVWEGLGRVVSGLNSSYYRNDAERQAARNAEESQNVIAQLLAQQAEGVDPNAGIAAAVSNPYISDIARQIALQQHQRSQEAWEPANDFERALFASGVQPGTPEWAEQNSLRAQNFADPVVFGQIGGRDFAGPRSWVVEDLMGGGGLASPGPQPGMVEDGYRFLGGDPSSPDSWEQVMDAAQGGQALSAASASQTITPEQAATVRQSLGPNGQQAFEEWLRNNNIEVRGR